MPHLFESFTLRGVTLRNILDNDAHAMDIVDLVKTDALTLHFAIDRVDVLGPPLDLAFHPCAGERPLQLTTNACDQLVAIGLFLLDRTLDFLVGDRV